MNKRYRLGDIEEAISETMYLRYAAMWMDWRKRLIP